MQIKTSIVSAVVVAMFAIAPMAYAQGEPSAPAAPGGPGGQMMQGPHHGEMRQKLLDACEGKKADDPCSFTRRNGSAVNGSCETRRGELLCIPAGMMHHGAMGGMGHMGGGTMGAPAGGANPGNQ